MHSRAQQKLPTQGFKLVAVVPAYNEERNLPRVLSELKSLRLSTCEVDQVVVDDGSADATRAVAREQGVRVVSLPYNMGIGLSVQTGFRYAVAHGADCVVQVDGDGQHIASEVEKLLPPLLSGQADVVVGTRFSQNSSSDGLRSTTFARWFAGRGLALAVRLLTGQHLTDTTSGFRLYSRKAAELIAEHYADDYPEVESLVFLARSGFRIVEVPVQMRPREHGSSSINWWRSIYYVIKVLFASCMGRLRGAKP